MTPKRITVLTFAIMALLLGLVAFTVHAPVAFVLAGCFAYTSLAVAIFGKKEENNYAALIIDSVLWGLI